MGVTSEDMIQTAVKSLRGHLEDHERTIVYLAMCALLGTQHRRELLTAMQVLMDGMDRKSTLVRDVIRHVAVMAHTGRKHGRDVVTLYRLAVKAATYPGDKAYLKETFAAMTIEKHKEAAAALEALR